MCGRHTQRQLPVHLEAKALDTLLFYSREIWEYFKEIEQEGDFVNK